MRLANHPVCAKAVAVGRRIKSRGVKRRSKVDEFGTGFIKNVMISFFLALFVSFLFVWFPDMFRP